MRVNFNHWEIDVDYRWVNKKNMTSALIEGWQAVTNAEVKALFGDDFSADYVYLHQEKPRAKDPYERHGYILVRTKPKKNPGLFARIISFIKRSIA
jgi:hypothetical protein